MWRSCCSVKQLVCSRFSSFDLNWVFDKCVFNATFDTYRRNYRHNKRKTKKTSVKHSEVLIKKSSKKVGRRTYSIWRALYVCKVFTFLVNHCESLLSMLVVNVSCWCYLSKLCLHFECHTALVKLLPEWQLH